MGVAAGVHSQAPYRCRLDWGRRGACAAADRGDIVIIVDVLSFSTAVAAAVHHGGVVYPCPGRAAAMALAERVGGEAAVSRRDVPAKGRFSLSPLTYSGIAPGTRIVLGGPNGARCCLEGQGAPHVLVGGLVNASAVADAAGRLLRQTEACITVVACGERWDPPGEDGSLRVAVEDYLCAGAILSGLAYSKSPEARVCEGAFRQVSGDLEQTLWECASGRELRAWGHGDDVRFAARLDVFDTVPAVPAFVGECLVSRRRLTTHHSTTHSAAGGLP